MSLSTTPEPLEEFFAQFASLGFTYNRNKTAHNNFKRLRKVSGWEQCSVALLTVREDFNVALVHQFNFLYGSANDLASWQNLCTVIDITPVPDNIKDCQKLVWDAHVNIVDLLECARTGQAVRKFADLEELRRYTKKPGKMFPKVNAYAGGLLKELLREIVNPYLGSRRNGSAKRKARKARRRAAAARSSE